MPGKPNGVFDIQRSDEHCGSFLKRRDLSETLKVSDADLSHLKFIVVDGEEVVNEREVQKAWYAGLIPNTQPAGKSSFDEVILSALVKKAWSDAKVFR